MKSILSLLKAGILLLMLSSVALSQKLVYAEINNPGCHRKLGIIIVPKGKVATDFYLEGVRAGVECRSGNPINRASFSIANQDYVFVYKSPINPKQGKLNITLPAGKYYLYVSGGNGARVELLYSIKSAK